jgi:hypothetical protein
MKISLFLPMMFSIVLAFTALFSLAGGTKKNIEDEPKLNVLFIAVDDLRPEIGAFYGQIGRSSSCFSKPLRAGSNLWGFQGEYPYRTVTKNSPAPSKFSHGTFSFQ